MLRARQRFLEDFAGTGLPEERALALAEMGRLDAALAVLDEALAGTPGRARADARIALHRGEPLRALHVLEGEAPDAVVDRAHVLGVLGRIDEALEFVAGPSFPMRLARAELHLLAGEPAPASVALPREAGPMGSGEVREDVLPEVAADARLLPLREALARGGIAGGESRWRDALASFRLGREHALDLDAVTYAARAHALLGEAHAAADNRWRALRAVTHAMDLCGAGGVGAHVRPGVHLRAWSVYARYGHDALAQSALQSGHHLVIEMASSIGERAYRETFLIDNPEHQRLIGAWKGESSWGLDMSRG